MQMLFHFTSAKLKYPKRMLYMLKQTPVGLSCTVRTVSSSAFSKEHITVYRYILSCLMSTSDRVQAQATNLTANRRACSVLRTARPRGLVFRDLCRDPVYSNDHTFLYQGLDS